MKKWLLIAGTFIGVLFNIALFTTCAFWVGDKPTSESSSMGSAGSTSEIISSIESANSSDSSTSEESPLPETKKDYTVKYYAVEKGEVVEILPELFLESGSYPTEYNAKETIKVSALKEIVFVSDMEDRMFLGWYADPDCNVYLGQTVNFKTTGDLILYAKLSVGYWTPNV